MEMQLLSLGCHNDALADMRETDLHLILSKGRVRMIGRKAQWMRLQQLAYFDWVCHLF